MESIFVLIDTDRRMIHILGSIVKSIPFKYAFILPSLICGKTVQLLQNPETVSGDEIVNWLASSLSEEDTPPQPLYFRCLQDGYVRVPDAKLNFSGPKDVKSFEKVGYDIFDVSPTMAKLLFDGKIEILTSEEMKSIKALKLNPKAKDEALDKILLKGSVKDFQENGMFEQMDDNKIDEVFSDEEGGKEELTDVQKILKENNNWGKK